MVKFNFYRKANFEDDLAVKYNIKLSQCVILANLPKTSKLMIDVQQNILTNQLFCNICRIIHCYIPMHQITNNTTGYTKYFLNSDCILELDSCIKPIEFCKYRFSYLLGELKVSHFCQMKFMLFHITTIKL